jgi:hypothetical protein
MEMVSYHNLETRLGIALNISLGYGMELNLYLAIVTFREYATKIYRSFIKDGNCLSLWSTRSFRVNNFQHRLKVGPTLSAFFQYLPSTLADAARAK